jgi:hypothetical protein
MMLATIPVNQLQPAPRNQPMQQPRQPIPAKSMPEVAKILNASSASLSNIKSIVPQTVDSSRKRKNSTVQNKVQKDGPEPPEKQVPAQMEVPFRMNIKKLNAGATKSTLLTLRQSLESKSGSGPTPQTSNTPTTANQLMVTPSDNIQQDSVSMQMPRIVSIVSANGPNPVLHSNNIDDASSSTQASTNGNSLSYGEVLKKAMANSLSENISTLAKQVNLSEELIPQEFDLSLIKQEPRMEISEPQIELFSKTIKLSEAPTDIKSLFLNFSGKTITRTVNCIIIAYL